MWQFDYPWLFLLLPLPWAAWRYLPIYQEARRAVRTPFFRAISQAVGVSPQQLGVQQARRQLLLNLLVWVLLICALARPVWVEPPLQQTRPVRDLLLAIDISQSMEARDYRDREGQLVDRLTAVKQVVQGFIDKRGEDRMGLIVFGGAAYPQAPLTLDHASLKILLDDVGIGMAGPNTAIGDAIGLGIKMLQPSQQTDKVLILLTDGNDNSIAIGDLSTTGEQKVDRAALEQIAKTTGGQAFIASDSQALQQVYDTLDRITPHQVQTLSHQPKRDLFWLPLGAALLLLTLYHSLAWWLLQRTTRVSTTEAA